MPVTYVHESSLNDIGTQTETSNMYFPTIIITITIKDVIVFKHGGFRHVELPSLELYH